MPKSKKSKVKRVAKRSSKKVRPIPEGFHSLTPYLAVRGAAQAIDWYKRAFGARERSRGLGPGGLILNAELKVGDSLFMLSDIFDFSEVKSPLELGGSPVTIHIYTNDVDSLFARAVAAGAKVTRDLADQFWGDRYGQLTDPYGHSWSLGTRKENLTRKQSAERAKQAMEMMAKKGGMP